MILNRNLRNAKPSIPSIITVLLTTVIYRSLSIGRTFFGDEGWYAGISYLAFVNAISGALDPAAIIPPLTTRTLNLYAILLAPLWHFGTNAIFLSRCVDALLMTLAMYCLLRFLRSIASESAALVATLCVVFILNKPVFIDAGFKNSFAPALIFLLLAFSAATSIITSSSPARPTKWAPQWMGIHGALAVLFRETFAPFALATLFLAVFVGRYSPRNIITAALSACCTIAIVVLACAWLRAPSIIEGLEHIVQGYFLDRQQQQHFAGRIYQNLWANIPVLQRNASFVLPLIAAWLLALFIPLHRRGKAQYTNLSIFATLAMLTPLIECFAKHSYPYHLSLTAIGMSVAIALGCDVITSVKSYNSRITLYAISAICSITFLATGGVPRSLISTARRPLAQLGVFSNLETPTPDENFYVTAARDVVRASRTHETLLTSGFTPAIFPLSQRLPAVDGVLDATWYRASYGDLPTAEVLDRLRISSPTMILRGQRDTESPDPETVVSNLVPQFPSSYHLVSIVPHGKQFYGFIRGKLYRKLGNDSLVTTRIPATALSNLAVADKSGNLLPFGELPALQHRRIAIRVLEERNPRSKGYNAMVRPLVDFEHGALALSAWQNSEEEWREWEFGGRLMPVKTGATLTWTGQTRGLSLVFLKESGSGIIELSIDDTPQIIDLYSEKEQWLSIPIEASEVEHLVFVPPSTEELKVSSRGGVVACLGLTLAKQAEQVAQSIPCTQYSETLTTVSLR